MKRCPFLKDINYTAGWDIGYGYPQDYSATEYFRECIGEECMAYYKKETYFPEFKYEDACALCKQ